MKVDELVELFLDTMTGGDDSDDTKSKWHPEVIKAALDLAIETIHSYKINLETRNGSYDPDGIDVLTKRVTCHPTDCENGYFGFDMPSAYQVLPGGAGIRLVAPQKGLSQFHKIASTAIYDFAALPAFTQGIWYSVTNQRINLYNLEPKEVTVIYVPKLLGMDGDEEINFLGDGLEIFQSAKTMLGEKLQILEDNVNQSIADK